MTVSSQGFSGVVIALVMRVVRGKGAGGLGLQRSRAGRHKVAHAHYMLTLADIPRDFLK